MFGFERHSHPCTFLIAKRKLVYSSHIKPFYANLAKYVMPHQYGSKSAGYTNITVLCVVFPWRCKTWFFTHCYLLWKENYSRSLGIYLTKHQQIVALILFLWYQPEQAVEQTVDLLMIWDAHVTGPECTVQNTNRKSKLVFTNPVLCFHKQARWWLQS